MPITGLAHVCLKVRNFQATAAFYQKLGFKAIFKFTRNKNDYGMYLQIAPGQFLEFFEESDSVVAGNAALTHFCLETDNIEILVEELAASGVSHTPKKLGPDDTWQIWLRDPDGIEFEVHQYTKTSRQFTGLGDVEADW